METDQRRVGCKVDDFVLRIVEPAHWLTASQSFQQPHHLEELEVPGFEAELLLDCRAVIFLLHQDLAARSRRPFAKNLLSLPGRHHQLAKAVQSAVKPQKILHDAGKQVDAVSYE